MSELMLQTMTQHQESTSTRANQRAPFAMTQRFLLTEKWMLTEKKDANNWALFSTFYTFLTLLRLAKEYFFLS